MVGCDQQMRYPRLKSLLKSLEKQLPRWLKPRGMTKVKGPSSLKLRTFKRDSLAGLEMYSTQLLDHFENPRNAGDVADADGRARVENPACGDILELSIKVQSGRISDIRFRAKGCVPAMACGSLITEMVAGKTMEEAGAITKEAVVREIGGLPEASGHAAQLAIDAVRAVLKKVTTRD
jgi:nitrogen fixation protein NifU and related proteins